MDAQQAYLVSTAFANLINSQMVHAIESFDLANTLLGFIFLVGHSMQLGWWVIFASLAPISLARAYFPPTDTPYPLIHALVGLWEYSKSKECRGYKEPFSNRGMHIAFEMDLDR